MKCPDCNSENITKNGSNSTKKQIYHCNSCGRYFVLDPIKQKISDEKKALIDKLLLEKVPLAGIARVVGVSERWLQTYVNEKYESIDKAVNVKKKLKND